MRIYIFETNNLSTYYAQSNNSTHDLTIKDFCILHQTYLFVHSVENGSKVISLGTWQLNTTSVWWLEKKTYVYFVIKVNRETSSRLRQFQNSCYFMLINGVSLSWPLQISSLSKIKLDYWSLDFDLHQDNFDIKKVFVDHVLR